MLLTGQRTLLQGNPPSSPAFDISGKGSELPRDWAVGRLFHFIATANASCVVHPSEAGSGLFEQPPDRLVRDAILCGQAPKALRLVVVYGFAPQ